MNSGFMTAAGPRDRASSLRACCRLGGASLVGGVEAIGRPGHVLLRKTAGSHRLCVTWVSRKRQKGLWAATPFACATYQFRNSNRTQVERRHVEWITTGSVLRWVRKVLR